MRQALMIAIGFGALFLGAQARAQDKGACAKIEEPLAYNACLARFGPPAYVNRGVAVPDGDPGAPVAEPHGHGRGRMEFNLGGKPRLPD